MALKIKKDCVAMLLAGGQGTRLGALTKHIAKPAVAFGGKYKIIDFTLSNCINSGIDTVGVLTQYQPLELNEYIGNGQPWDLDRDNGGVHILPPYLRGEDGDWYKGTGNAIYQNIRFIDRYNPDHVLVLSGDHIYKMNYGWMLTEHERTGADCTIAVIQVPIDEAPRFGIVNTREDGTIYEFEEKPEKPKSNNASMGVYIFKWEKLRQYLIEDSKDADSSNDFGQNILPNMLRAGEKMMAYNYEGYWKDVGTIGSLWEANMDLVNSVKIKINDPKWKIYSRNSYEPPHYIGGGARVNNSIVSEGSEVYGDIRRSVLFHSTRIGKGAVIRDSVIMPGAVVMEGAVVEYAIVAEDAVIHPGAHVGVSPEHFAGGGEWGITLIASGVHIGEGVTVGANQMIEEDM